MSKGIQPPVDRVLDLAIEIIMLISIGLPICSILLVLVLSSCLICLPLFVLAAPFLCLSRHFRKRAMIHPLSDWILGMTEPF